MTLPSAVEAPMPTDRAWWWRSPLVLPTIMVLAALLRLVALDADPHRVVQKGVIYDAGEYQKNARQEVLFGRARLDDYNPELAVAPAHTAILTAVYRVAGVGFWQMVLPQALAGLVTVLLVYLLARGMVGETGARIAMLIQATSLFSVAYDRSGFIESLQLCFLMAMVLFGWRAVQRPWLGLLGGTFAAASILTKPTALIMGIVLAVGWGVLWRQARRDPASPRFRWAGLMLFAVATAVVLGVVFATLISHLLPDLQRFFAASAGGVFDGGSRALQYVRTRFFGIGFLGMSLNGFFVGTAGLQIVVAWFAARRIVDSVAERITPLEWLAWIWLGLGLFYLSLQHYQPARRFLLFVPPLALLAARAVTATYRPADPAKWRRALTGFLIGGVAGFLLGGWLGIPVSQAIKAATGHDVSLATSRSLLWSGFAIAGPVLALGVPRWFGGLVARPPLALVLAVAVVIDFGQSVAYLIQPIRTIEAASQSLGRLTANWPEDRRSIFGGEANTLAIETNLIGHGQAPEQGDWKVYRPSLVTVTRFAGAAADSSLKQHPDYRLCRVLQLGPLIDGVPRYVVALYIVPELLSECLAWAAAEGH